MIELAINDVDGFVERLRHKGTNVRWDGWTMVFFRPDGRAWRSKFGKRHNEQWGFETRISPNAKGLWRVDKRLVK